MASGWTDRGLYLRDLLFFRGTSPATAFYVAAVTSATTPDKATNTLGQLTEIAAGNGYSAGGVQITRDATGFPTITEDDATGYAEGVAKDAVFTAAGGAIPASGNPIRWFVLTTDEATVANRQVIAWMDPNNTITLADGQTFKVLSQAFRTLQS